MISQLPSQKMHRLHAVVVVILVLAVILPGLARLAPSKAAELDDDWSTLQGMLGGMKAVVTAPISGVVTGKFSPGQLLGNGDIGVVAGDTNTRQKFYFGKSDFWGNARRDATTFQAGILSLGGLNISSPTASPSPATHYRMEQDLLSAQVNTTMQLGNTVVTMRSWTADSENTFVTELSSAAGSPAVTIKLDLWMPNDSVYPATSGISGGALWVTRENNLNGSSDYKARVVIATRVVGVTPSGTVDGAVNASGNVTLNGGATLYVVSVFRSDAKIGGATSSAATLRDSALSRANAITSADIATLRTNHRDWWKSFWLKSYVRLGDSTLEKYYYGALYVAGSATRSNVKTAPSLWGQWITNDSAGWGGRYFLNYNAEALYYGLFSSNRPELSLPFNEVILKDVAWQRNKTHAAGYQGVTFQRTLTPFNLPRSAPATSPVAATKDWRKLPADQKSNGVFAALPMIWYYEYTRDINYLQTKVYPLIKEMDAFYRDYMTWDGSRYVIAHSSAHEGSDDLNPNLDLGFFRKIEKFLLETSVTLGVDSSLRPVWQDVLAKLSKYPSGTVNGKTVYYIAETVDYFDSTGRQDGVLFEPGDQPINLEGTVHPGENLAVGGSASELQIAINSMQEMNSWGVTSGGNSYNGFPKIFPIAARIGWPAEDLFNKFKAAINYRWRSSNLTVAQGGGGIETSGSIEAVNSMLLQHEAGVMRLFPSWPVARNASFKRLRAKGAFLVSGELAGGVVGPITIASEQGRPLTIKSPWSSGTPRVEEIDADGAVLATVDHTFSGSNISFSTAAGKRYRLSNGPATTPVASSTRTSTATSGPSPTPTRSPTQGTTPSVCNGGHYRLMARHSGKAAVVQSAALTDGAAIVQYTYGGTNTNDEWQLVAIGGGFCRIVNRMSGRDMAVQSASLTDGAKLIQWTYGGTNTNDEWQIVNLGGGYYRLNNRMSGKAAEVTGAGIANGDTLQQMPWSGATHQQWQIIAVP